MDDEQQSSAAFPAMPIMPDDIRQDQRLHAMLLSHLESCRKEAVLHRFNVGIDDLWDTLEDNYIGTDEGASAGRRIWQKPTVLDAPAQLNDDGKPEQPRSNVFVRLTAKYVDAASEKIAELLIPSVGKAFSIEPTPVGEDMDSDALNEPVVENGVELGRPLNETEKQQRIQSGMGAPTDDEEVPLRHADLLAEKRQRLAEQAKRAERRIEDWMAHSHWPSVCNEVLFDAARLGVGVVKNFPINHKARKMDENGNAEVTMVPMPSVKSVRPRDLFPDPGCGDRIENGNYVCERAYISEKQLAELKGQPNYWPDAIDSALAEGPRRVEPMTNGEDLQREMEQANTRTKPYELWHFYGAIRLDELPFMASEGLMASSPCAAMTDIINVVCTTVNDRLVSVTRNPHNSGAFPFLAFPWRRRPTSWTGIGVGEQMIVPQFLVNGATRALNDNAALASGVQIILGSGVYPEDEEYTVTPNKLWRLSDDQPSQRADEAMRTFVFPSRIRELLAFIDFALRLAEESTNIPLISGGQSGATQHQTLGGVTLQNNNANQLLRGVARQFDELLMKPLIELFYDELLVNKSVPSEEKGDWKIVPLASSVLVERAIRDDFLLALTDISFRPESGIDPEKFTEILLQSRRIDASTIMRTEDERKSRRESPPPPDPTVLAAEVRAEIEKHKTEAMATIKREELAAKERMHAEQDKRAAVRDAESIKESEAERDMRFRVAILDYANKHETTLEKAKADLTKVVLTLRTQERLAKMRDGVVGQVAHTPAEPPGRAEDGRAFEQ